MFITLSHYHYILVFRDLQRILTTKLAIRSGLVVPCCPAWHGRAPFILNQWIWSCDQRDEEHQFEDFFGDGDGEREWERERERILWFRESSCLCSLVLWSIGSRTPLYYLIFPFCPCKLRSASWEVRIYIYSLCSRLKTPVTLQVKMARLNHCNVLCHFSHSGVDDMSEACP